MQEKTAKELADAIREGADSFNSAMEKAFNAGIRFNLSCRDGKAAGLYIDSPIIFIDNIHLKL